MLLGLASSDIENNEVTNSTNMPPSVAPVDTTDNTKTSGAYNTSYVLLVLDIMNKVGLAPIQDLMNTEAKLMDVTAQMQSDLTTVQNYISRIQNLATSGGCYQAGGMLDPNANNGISASEFHESTLFTIPQTKINGQPNPFYYESDDLHSATVDFINAMKDIYSCPVIDDPNQTNPDNACNYSEITVNKTNVDGKIVTEKFSLAQKFNQLNYANEWGVLEKWTGKTFVMGTPLGTTTQYQASLMQKYVYYQYKLAAEQHTGMIDNLDTLGISFLPSSENFDGEARAMYNFVNSFNTADTTSRQGLGGAPNGLISSSTGNILGWIFASDPFQLYHSGSVWGPNILGCFSYLAFNYYWTKNPNASTDGNDYRGAAPVGGGWSYKGDNNSANKGEPSADKLSSMYSATQSASSVISNNSNTAGTTEQKYTSEVSQYQNIGQNIIKSDHTGNKTTITNFRST